MRGPPTLSTSSGCPWMSSVLCPQLTSRLPRPRRPEAEEMETLRIRDVRPLVEIGQEEVCLLMLQRPLRLLWRWRSGGCLGPAAAAEMNRRQGLPRPGPGLHRRLASGSGLSPLLQGLPGPVLPGVGQGPPPRLPALGLPPLPPGHLPEQQQTGEHQWKAAPEPRLPEASGGGHPDPPGSDEAPSG